MKDMLFNHKYINKDGSIDYERFSKASGMSKADLSFLLKSDFDLIDRASMLSGVFVGVLPVVKNNIFEQAWDLRTYHNNPQDLAYITKLITNHGNDFNRLYEYFVMDSAGNILSANLNVKSVIADNGVIHLSTADESLSEYVYPATLKKSSYKCFYCHDKSLDKLNNQIQTYVDKKYIDKPSTFNGGFQLPAQSEERQQ